MLNRHQLKSTSTYRILIVEDQIVHAKLLTRYLRRLGHQVIACALSYEETINALQEEVPDLVVLDVRIRGQKNGIQVAQYLQKHYPQVPHLFLSSQVDKRTLQEAKATRPIGFLSKPVQFASIFTTIEMAMHRQQVHREQLKRNTLLIEDGDQQIRVDLQEIMLLAAEHIYVRIFLRNGQEIVHRSTLARLIQQLPGRTFMSIHRSYVVNIRHVERWGESSVTLQGKVLPLSRYRRKEVMRKLKSWVG